MGGRNGRCSPERATGVIWPIEAGCFEVIDTGQTMAPYWAQYAQAQPQQQPQQQGGGINPMQLQKLKSLLGGGSSGYAGFSGFGENTIPSITGGGNSLADLSSFGLDDAGGGSAGGAGGGGGYAGVASNPYAWLGALLGGTALATQHNNVSSIPHWLQGQFGSDMVDSPNVQNFGKKIFGDKLTNVQTSAARPFWDSISPREWKKWPSDIVGSIKSLGKLL